VCLAVILLLAAAATAACVALEKRAFGGDCNIIRDPDERHMCLAVTQRLKSECEFIKKPDLRQECRIRLERHP
jgi:hypothetical protein